MLIKRLGRRKEKEGGTYLDNLRATYACTAEQAADDATYIELAVFVCDNAVGKKREGGKEKGKSG